jgi:hypothetical protein
LRGISAIISPKSNKLGKQIEFAAKIGAKKVHFPAFEPGSKDKVKDIITGEQIEVH